MQNRHGSVSYWFLSLRVEQIFLVLQTFQRICSLPLHPLLGMPLFLLLMCRLSRYDASR